MNTLFDRLGGEAGIGALVERIAGAHLDNPVIRNRFLPLTADPEKLQVALGHLKTFLVQGSGGPARYAGRSMPDAHRGMNISGSEYLAAVDDIMSALVASGHDEQTQKDVLFIAYSLKPQIMGL